MIVDAVAVDAAASHDGDDYMLLDVEGPRIEGEAPPSRHRDGLLRERRRHELADGEGDYLNEDSRDVQWLGSVGEESVKEDQDSA